MRKSILKQRIADMEERTISLITKFRIQLKCVNDEQDELLNEVDRLKEKNLSLQRDKESLIEYVKKLRYMHECAEDEIKRIKDICNMLNQNIEDQNVTIAQNDIAYYKLLEQNAFLAGQVKAYEQSLNSNEINKV